MATTVSFLKISVRMLQYIQKDCEARTPALILDKLDHYGWNIEWHMSLGDDKRKIVSEIISRKIGNSENSNLTLVECGSYVGYSTVLFGSLLRKNDRVISIESVPEFSEVTAKLCHLAGLKNVEFIPKASQDAIKENYKKFDLKIISFAL